MDNKNENTTAPQGVSLEYTIPPEGSLGLLAIGWRGLQHWRAARAAAVQQQKNQDNEQNG